MIDDRAAIHPDARIGSDVSIGPFTIVEAGVTIGSGTRVGSHVVIREGTRLGQDNHIYSFASIGEDPQFAGYSGENTVLEVGDHNVIREYVTLNRGSPAGTGTTQIGSHNFLMAYCHIAHDSVLGDHIVFANGASLAGHVVVGDYAILGGFTLVHQFCRVGTHCLTGIGTVALKDVAPYVIVAGNPAKTYGVNVRGLRRRGFGEDQIVELKKTYKEVFRNTACTNSESISYNKASPGGSPSEQLLTFAGDSRRGLIR
ncbi:MAG: acyl-ACP--UDP-N-acetylglucosamine O-acyltransferase [Arenicellales bacterium]|nr:acyl-ACP--UDP-N-acetylglucosamine O-acyltransferase [Arenicellales bacterium]